MAKIDTLCSEQCLKTYRTLNKYLEQSEFKSKKWSQSNICYKFKPNNKGDIHITTATRRKQKQKSI